MKRKVYVSALVTTAAIAMAPVALGAAGDECAKVLGYEWSGEKQSMDPADMHSGDDAYHIFAVYNRLVDVDDNFKVLPGARDRMVRVRRRPDLDLQVCAKASSSTTASDFDAADVVYTFKRLLDPATASARRRCCTSSSPTSIKAVDPLTVTFTHQGAGGRVSAPDHEQVHEHRRRRAPSTTTCASRATAPGRSCRRSSRRTRRCASFARTRTTGTPGKPKAECLRVTVAQEPVAAVSAIKAGEVDLVLNVDPVVIPRCKNDPNVELLETGASNSMTVSMWIDTPPFDDIGCARR